MKMVFYKVLSERAGMQWHGGVRALLIRSAKFFSPQRARRTRRKQRIRLRLFFYWRWATRGGLAAMRVRAGRNKAASAMRRSAIASQAKASPMAWKRVGLWVAGTVAVRVTKGAAALRRSARMRPRLSVTVR